MIFYTNLFVTNYVSHAFHCLLGLTDNQHYVRGKHFVARKHNKQLHISSQNISKSRYESRVALSACFPALDFNGGYAYNEKNLSLFDSDQMLPTKSFNASTGSYEYNLVSNPATGQPVKSPDGKFIPETVALIPKEAMNFDIHNVFFGSVTLTQPVFMGGKIIAMPKT